MAQHRNKPSCYACHGILDPMGFALENFDAVGVWRTRDRIVRTQVDTDGELPDGSKVTGVDGTRQALVANADQFVQTLTEKLMTYGTGRTITWRDMPTVRRIVHESAGEGHRFSSIVLRIVDSDQFQMRSSTPPAAHRRRRTIRDPGDRVGNAARPRSPPAVAAQADTHRVR